MICIRSIQTFLFAIGLSGGTASAYQGLEQGAHETNIQAAYRTVINRPSISFKYAGFETIPAGIAGDRKVVFIGFPMEGRVGVLERRTGLPLGDLPAPESGFMMPFILHSVGPNRVAVLDAGGFPSPQPFFPANPTIYEYEYEQDAGGEFHARLTNSINFKSVEIGFAEDFVKLPNGRYVISDAILGAIWLADSNNGIVEPGIVPQSRAATDAIPKLTMCPDMPMMQVGGIPFLFTGSTLPGISPLALRFDKLYFYSPCAEGLYSIPLSAFSDERLPHERASDIRLVSPKPADTTAEQLLGLSFPSNRPDSPWLYAADSLQQRVIRINVNTGQRQVVAADPSLFNFPSSMAFLPPLVDFLSISPLLVISNQQHLLTLTNDALEFDMPQIPFLATTIVVGAAGSILSGMR